MSPFPPENLKKNLKSEPKIEQSHSTRIYFKDNYLYFVLALNLKPCVGLAELLKVAKPKFRFGHFRSFMRTTPVCL